jgi:hypothetical protein
VSTARTRRITSSSGVNSSVSFMMLPPTLSGAVTIHILPEHGFAWNTETTLTLPQFGHVSRCGYDGRHLDMLSMVAAAPENGAARLLGALERCNYWAALMVSAARTRRTTRSSIPNSSVSFMMLPPALSGAVDTHILPKHRFAWNTETTLTLPQFGHVSVVLIAYGPPKPLDRCFEPPCRAGRPGACKAHVPQVPPTS